MAKLVSAYVVTQLLVVLHKWWWLLALGSGPSSSAWNALPSQFFPLTKPLLLWWLSLDVTSHQNLSTLLTLAWLSLLSVSIRPHASLVWPLPFFVIVTFHVSACVYHWTVSFFRKRPILSIFLSSLTFSHDLFIHQLIWLNANYARGCVHGRCRVCSRKVWKARNEWS